MRVVLLGRILEVFSSLLVDSEDENDEIRIKAGRMKKIAFLNLRFK